MNKLMILFFTLCCLVVSSAYASDESELVFQCQTVKKRTLKIIREKDTLVYSYWNRDKEELHLVRTLFNDKIPGVFAPGVILENKSGQYIYNSITFENGEYEYTVTALSDIFVPTDKTFTGIRVSKDGLDVAELKCSEKDIKDNFESLHVYMRLKYS